jgi:hypothetical protein
MKLTDLEVVTMLKAFTPKEILAKYLDGIIRLSAKQSNRLIEVKNEERDVFMTEKEIEELEKIAHDEDAIKLERLEENEE